MEETPFLNRKPLTHVVNNKNLYLKSVFEPLDLNIQTDALSTYLHPSSYVLRAYAAAAETVHGGSPDEPLPNTLSGVAAQRPPRSLLIANVFHLHINDVCVCVRARARAMQLEQISCIRAGSVLSLHHPPPSIIQSAKGTGNQARHLQ